MSNVNNDSTVCHFFEDQFFVQVVDDSMSMTAGSSEKSIDPGNSVLFDFKAPIRAGDIVLADVDGYEDEIIRIYKPSDTGHGSEFYLVPNNPGFATETIGRGKTGRIIARAMRLEKSI
jgi:SOS-response transcriptional repressor LexA